MTMVARKTVTNGTGATTTGATTTGTAAPTTASPPPAPRRRHHRHHATTIAARVTTSKDKPDLDRQIWHSLSANLRASLISRLQCWFTLGLDVPMVWPDRRHCSQRTSPLS
jgi:hypothetical protein